MDVLVFLCVEMTLHALSLTLYILANTRLVLIQVGRLLSKDILLIVFMIFSQEYTYMS